MRLFATVAAAALLLLGIAGCVPGSAVNDGLGAHPNLIIVREFAVSPGVITLDPSFGFSLHRGAPGVPPRQRAAAVGRAAAFSLADILTQQLASLGYDAVLSNTIGPAPGGRALIVSGAFRGIHEGYRRQNASIAAAAAIDYQAAGDQPHRLIAFNVDSRRVSEGGAVGVSPRRGRDVNYAAARLGAAIARTVAEAARLNHWPAAPR